MAIVNIGLGSNIGDGRQNLRVAVYQLRKLGTVVSLSPFYVTKPWGLTDQEDFYNAVVQIDTTLAPHTLLLRLKEIELEMGRTPTVRWGPRLIDLDILTYDESVVDEPGLTIPHLRMEERAFVIVPLCDIDSRFLPMLYKLSKEALFSVTLLPAQ